MKIQFQSFRKPRIEMVPLIDSFFLLLAFFMSSVLAMEVVRGLPVELPKSGKAVRILQEDRLIITLARDGRLQLEGQELTLELLQARLSAYPHRQELRVGIRADKGTAYERLIQVLAALRGAGVGKVSLLTQPEQPRGKETLLRGISLDENF